uniref:Uncharacterized protein n=1 Tax=Rhizophora mucronata TaxID=61149 RepID=A0A2P2P7D3_RHIMU
MSTPSRYQISTQRLRGYSRAIGPPTCRSTTPIPS